MLPGQLRFLLSFLPLPNILRDEPRRTSDDPLLQAPQGGPIVFKSSVEPPYANLVALSNLYRSVSIYPHHEHYEARRRAEENHFLLRTYIQACYYVPLRARSSAKDRLERYPPVRAALRRIQRAVQKNDEEAFHRAWLALSLRGKELLSQTFNEQVTSFRDPHGLDLLDPRWPSRPPSWLRYYSKHVIAAVVTRAIKLNSGQGRRYSREQDAAAAEIVAAYSFLTGTAPTICAAPRARS